MDICSKEGVGLREDFEAVAQKVKEYWFAGTGGPMPFVEHRKFSIVTNIRDLEEMPEEAADMLDFALKSASPVILQESRLYMKRLSTIPFKKVTSGLLVGLQSFHLGIKAYVEMCPGAELTYITPSAKPEAVIGKGHFGQVVLTEFDGKPAAKKQLNRTNNGSSFSVFVQELWIWRMLTVEGSPYVVRLLAAGVDPQTENFVYVSDFAKQRSLRFALKQQRLQHLAFVKGVAKDIARGLNHMHKRNLVHHDLKPSNVLLFREKGKLVAKLCDFGISQYVPGRSRPGAVNFLGSGIYMPPEARLWGYVAPSNDIFAFGLLLFELLEPGFDQLKREDLRYLCSSRLRFERTVLSPAVKELILNCTNYTHTERPTTAELVSRLGKLRMTKPMPEKLFSFMLQSCLPSENGSVQRTQAQADVLSRPHTKKEADALNRPECPKQPNGRTRIRKGATGTSVARSSPGSAKGVEARLPVAATGLQSKPHSQSLKPSKHTATSSSEKSVTKPPGLAEPAESQVAQLRTEAVPKGGVPWMILSGATSVCKNMIAPCLCGLIRRRPFADGLQPVTEADRLASRKQLPIYLQAPHNGKSPAPSRPRATTVAKAKDQV